MCLRFVCLLITRVTAWLRLSRREDAWKIAEILILRHQLLVCSAQGMAMPVCACSCVIEGSSPQSSIR
jgi:hypothetical protein